MPAALAQVSHSYFEKYDREIAGSFSAIRKEASALAELSCAGKSDPNSATLCTTSKELLVVKPFKSEELFGISSTLFEVSVKTIPWLDRNLGGALSNLANDVQQTGQYTKHKEVAESYRPLDGYMLYFSFFWPHLLVIALALRFSKALASYAL